MVKRKRSRPEEKIWRRGNIFVQIMLEYFCTGFCFQSLWETCFLPHTDFSPLSPGVSTTLHSTPAGILACCNIMNQISPSDLEASMCLKCNFNIQTGGVCGEGGRNQNNIVWSERISISPSHMEDLLTPSEIKI